MKVKLIGFVIIVFLGVAKSAKLSRKELAVELGRRRVGSKPTTESHIEDQEYELVDLPAECPEPNGYFPHPDQCDKYFDCQDGQFTEKLCPDGLVFNDFSPQHEKCDLPFNIDCSKRLDRQQPQPSLHCPRLHGYFAHENPAVCDVFYYCVDGKFNMITCPAGLVFSEKTGICNWPDEAQKKGCGSQELFNFTCPHVNETVAATHPRYPDVEDCQYFYVCVNGVVPRRSGCKLGQAFDERTGKCDWARKIPECKDWYKDQLTDAELDALENPVKRILSGEKRTRRPNSAPVL